MKKPLTMHCDFNNVDVRGCVLAGLPELVDLRPLVGIGDTVILDDGEGNGVQGYITGINPGHNDNYATCNVRIVENTRRTEPQA